MPMPEPGTRAHDEMVDFMRADLESKGSLTRIISSARELLKSQGRDFDKEFEAYLKQKRR